MRAALEGGYGLRRYDGGSQRYMAVGHRLRHEFRTSQVHDLGRCIRHGARVLCGYGDLRNIRRKDLPSFEKSRSCEKFVFAQT